VLFRKRRDTIPPEVRKRASQDAGEMPELIFIDFDMMLKGSVATRKGKTIRQYCVTVDGATRLVTSGDTVDKKTFNALVAAGAVAPWPSSPAPPELDAEQTPDDGEELRKE
jgi:hypothetical protein